MFWNAPSQIDTNSASSCSEVTLRKKEGSQLFYNTQIPACLWFLAKNKNADAKRGFGDSRHQTLVFESYIRCASHPSAWHN